jgi:hypothetical protein
MPGVERDIGRCLDFACGQPQGNAGELKSEIQRGVAWICAKPHTNRPELKLADPGWWLRRYKAAHTLIVYAYIPPTGPRSRGVVILVAVRYMRVASPSVESETAVTNFVPTPDEPDFSDISGCSTVYEEDEIDWDEVVAAVEEDGNSEELAFNSAEYATEEAAMHALRAFIHEIFEEVERDAASDPALDAAGQTGYPKGTHLHSPAALGKASGS